ncbi:MAG: hypothetical protein AAGE52_01410 [Myxococcota bacterium]
MGSYVHSEDTSLIWKLRHENAQLRKELADLRAVGEVRAVLPTTTQQAERLRGLAKQIELLADELPGMHEYRDLRDEIVRLRVQLANERQERREREGT